MDYGIGRGSVSFDYDNDGDLDLFVVNQRPVYDLSSSGGVVKSKLYKNISKNDNNWLKIKLNGISSTTRGLGARVKVVCGNLNLIRRLMADQAMLHRIVLYFILVLLRTKLLTR